MSVSDGWLARACRFGRRQRPALPQQSTGRRRWRRLPRRSSLTARRLATGQPRRPTALTFQSNKRGQAWHEQSCIAFCLSLWMFMTKRCVKKIRWTENNSRGSARGTAAHAFHHAVQIFEPVHRHTQCRTPLCIRVLPPSFSKRLPASALFPAVPEQPCAGCRLRPGPAAAGGPVPTG